MTARARMRFVAAGAGATVWMGLSALGAPPTYQIMRAGLTDAEHTSASGERFSTGWGLNSAGHMAGTSIRYDGTAQRGFTAWWFDRATGATTPIGLRDAEHTRSDGTREAEIAGFNSAGQVLGHASRFIGAEGRGTSAWLYSPGTNTTTRLGFFGPDYTAPDGEQTTYVYLGPDGLSDQGEVIGQSYPGGVPALSVHTWFYDAPTNTTTRIGYTDALHTGAGAEQQTNLRAIVGSGKVIGTSRQYGSPDLRFSAFIAVGVSNALTRLGFTDAAHTDPSGYQYSDITAHNRAGVVVGRSARFDQPSGQSAWRYDDATGTTVQLGFTDTEHTAADGRQHSDAYHVSSAGHVAGSSARAGDGGLTGGQTAWVRNAGTGVTKAIGLTDAQHIAANGYRSSSPQLINDAGHVAGIAQLAGGFSGESAWLYDPVTDITSHVGLTDAEHTAANGQRRSFPEGLNHAGVVIGWSSRTLSGVIDNTRTSTWRFNPATGATQETGLNDATHTSSSGLQASVNFGINSAGDAVGGSARYSGDTPVGLSGWFAPADGSATLPLVFSIGDNGQVFTIPQLLTDAGVVLGYYTPYSGNTELPNRAFWWNMTDGFFDLGQLVGGGLNAAGWQQLSNVFDQRNGMIFGEGTLIGQNETGVYLLVPGPHAAGIIGCAALIAICRRRREDAIR